MLSELTALPFLAYMLGNNFLHLFLFLLGSFAVFKHFRKLHTGDDIKFIQSENAIPISILVPAHNEEKGIVESIQSLFNLDYPQFEIIVINDGSTDNTLGVLTEQLDLVKIDKNFPPQLFSHVINEVYRSRVDSRVTVLNKEKGGKADALNAGINAAQWDHICSIDADSVLERDALLRISYPFLEDQDMVAVGGTIRIGNGCKIQDGFIERFGLTSHPLVIYQIVEYLRSFICGRLAMAQFNTLSIISGAFGAFRKDVVIQAGGYKHDSVTEDVELILSIHRYHQSKGLPYNMGFVPSPVCWTEAPDNFSTLARQRERWHRGLIDSFWRHRDTFARFKYGRLGMFIMPYLLFIELLGPVVEILGLVLLPVLVALGWLDITYFALFLGFSVMFGMTLSLFCVLVEDLGFPRYPRIKHLLVLCFFAFLENFGYRQLTLLWRLQAFVKYYKRDKTWGHMPRKGFISHKKKNQPVQILPANQDWVPVASSRKVSTSA